MLVSGSLFRVIKSHDCVVKVNISDQLIRVANRLIDYICRISVILQWPVHLSMLFRSSFNKHYTQYSFQASGCFPQNHRQNSRLP